MTPYLQQKWINNNLTTATANLVFKNSYNPPGLIEKSHYIILNASSNTSKSLNIFKVHTTILLRHYTSLKCFPQYFQVTETRLGPRCGQTGASVCVSHDAAFTGQISVCDFFQSRSAQELRPWELHQGSLCLLMFQNKTWNMLHHSTHHTLCRIQQFWRDFLHLPTTTQLNTGTISHGYYTLP